MAGGADPRDPSRMSSSAMPQHGVMGGASQMNSALRRGSASKDGADLPGRSMSSRQQKK